MYVLVCKPPWSRCCDICAMTRVYVCHDSSMCLSWFVNMCACVWFPMIALLWYMCHDSYICVPWLIHVFVTIRSYACMCVIPPPPWPHCCNMCAANHSYMYMTLIYVFLDSFVRVHYSFICVPWLVCTCAMTQACMFMRVSLHDRAAVVRVPWLTSMCTMTDLYMCHDSFICVTWFIYMCAMTHSYMCHDSFI